MRVLPPTPSSLDIAAAALAAGGLVIHPTETCYGIACDITNPAAIARLFVLKQRPLNQPVSALFSSITQVKEYVLWNEDVEKLAQKHLPGPLTLILPLRTDAKYILYPTPPPGLSGASFQTLDSTNRPPLEATIGIRISSHPVAQKLVTLFGKPISTTSANVHGQPAAYSTTEILSQFPDDLPDIFLIDGGSLPLHPPSTIIDLTGPFPKELRRGNLNP